MATKYAEIRADFGLVPMHVTLILPLGLLEMALRTQAGGSSVLRTAVRCGTSQSVNHRETPCLPRPALVTVGVGDGENYTRYESVPS